MGVGITYSAAIEPLLDRYPESFQALEVEPQTTWLKVTRGGTSSYQADKAMLEHLRRLPGRKIIHSVGAPVGGSVRAEPVHLQLLRDTVEFFASPWASDHLSFNQTPEFATGFFLPPRQTPENIRGITTAIHDLQTALRVPVAVETGVNYLRPRKDELPDGEFVAQVVESAECGLLLDLHNIFANSLNGRQPIDEYLERLPLERVWEIHLAGGMELDGFWLDAHSGAIPDPLYKVAELLVPRLPNLKAIIFEIFPSFVPLVGLELVREQVESLHALWARRSTAPKSLSRTRLRPQNSPSGGGAPEVWERALGKLVIGRSADDDLSEELQHDPGIRIVKGLIHEFRASMIVGVLRLTSRLLLLSLGSEAFRTILGHYWSQVPPQMYASLEAEAFAAHLEALDLQVPHLAKILEFEQTVIAVLTDGRNRVVHFAFEPIPLLRALAEGRLPGEIIRSGDFEIELTADGLGNATGIDMEALKQAFPYH